MTKPARAKPAAAAPPTPREEDKPRINILVYHAILEHSLATGAGLALLLVLARFANDAGKCWPSIPTLAKLCHVTERAIQRTIASLIAQSELVVEQPGGGRLTNSFRICCVRPVNKASPVKEASPVNKPSPVTKVVSRGEGSVTAAVKKPSPKEPMKNHEEPKKGGEPPENHKAANQKPQTRTLWPAEQPAAATAVMDKHAEMWTALIHHDAGFPLPEKFDNDPDAKGLMKEGLIHVGSWTRIRGFRERPGDASFARKEFLDYLRNHDPAYESAVGQAIAESLERARAPAAKAKAKSAGGGNR